MSSELALKSNPPQHWVFSWSLPTAVNSVLRDKKLNFAKFINISIRKSWPHFNTFTKVKDANWGTPVPKVCGDDIDIRG